MHEHVVGALVETGLCASLVNFSTTGPPHSFMALCYFISRGREGERGGRKEEGGKREKERD